MTARRWFVVTVVCVAGALSGCHTNHETLAPASNLAGFDRSADGICQSATQAVSALTAPDDETDLPGWARYGEASLTLLTREAGDLEAVAGDPVHERVSGFLGHARRQVEITQALTWAAHATDTTAVRFELLELRTEHARFLQSAKALGMHACSGADADLPGPLPTPSAGLTHTSFVGVANSLCAHTSVAVAALPPAKTLPALHDYLGQVLILDEALDQQLTGLRPPAADAKAFTKLTRSRAQVLTAIRQARAAAGSGRAAPTDQALTRVKAAARAYAARARAAGLTACG